MQQYPHMSLAADRRDSGLDSNGSTPFQSHSINHALGIPGYPRHPGDSSYRISSPSSNAPQQQQQQQQPQQSLQFVSTGHSSPPQKRKHVDPVMNPHNNKRRREPDDSEAFDEGGGQGAKHWTDEEKSKLFKWLMGPGQDDHWNSLRATKNSCLRECANEVFGGKKTYQALKGCYERNFNLFKQIYSFENHHTNSTPMNPSMSEADSLREYEKRLQIAKKAGCDVGNITARTIDHWHRNGWYELFYRRWHGDPAATRPTAGHRGVSSHVNGTGDDPEGDDDQNMDFPEPMTLSHTHSSVPPPAHERQSMPVTYVNPQSIQSMPTISSSPTAAALTNGVHHQHQQPQPPPPPPPAPSSAMGIPSSSIAPLNSMANSIPSPAVSAATTSTLASNSTLGSASIPTSLSSSTPLSSAIPPPPSSAGSSDQSIVNISLTQGMVTSFLHYLQVQTQTGKMKMEYLRKREEREERESVQRREVERLKLERERAEFEHQKQTSSHKQKTERAIELLSNDNIDPGVKKAAADFLKRMFSTD
ncbi:Histone acetyltransferase [Stygiomarasmius scandens]|uniref:Histone acetyltransferase n=1 Tax=Marasmiellus scandens TaxID=2682957 RepID=A0ABR1JDX9_9AGAR